MEDIRKKLFELQDIKYKEFHSKLCPNTDNIIGVRVPKLRELAKEIAKDDYKEFLRKIESKYYEENMLHGLVIGYAKISIEETLEYLKIFIPKIDNWAVCDTTCSNLKITKKYLKEMWDFIEKYIQSKNEFEVRFAVVMYLNYFIVDEYIDKVLLKIKEIKNNDYYVQMAVAWLISVAYIKQKEKTEFFLANNDLDKFTQNKAIQKICESYRVKKEDKKLILKYKK